MEREEKRVIFALIMSASMTITAIFVAVTCSMPKEFNPIPIPTAGSAITGINTEGNTFQSEYSPMDNISEIEIRFYFDIGREHGGICFGNVRDQDLHMYLTFKVLSGVIGNIEAGWGYMAFVCPCCRTSFLSEGNLAGTWSPGDFLVGDKMYAINGRAPVVWPARDECGDNLSCFIFFTCQAAGNNPFSISLLSSELEDIIPSGKDQMVIATVIALVFSATFAILAAFHFYRTSSRRSSPGASTSK